MRGAPTRKNAASGDPRPARDEPPAFVALSPAMTNNDRLLCLAYAAIAVAALMMTWSNNLAFFALPDNGGIGGFIAAGFANPAAASLSWDLAFLGIAALVWMGVEARQHGIRFFWVYVVMSLTVAISVAFPLFLIARQLRLAQQPRSGRA